MTPPRGHLRGVLFDAVGTLMVPDPPVATAYRRVAEQFGSTLSEAEISARFRQAFARQESLDQHTYGLRTDEARERLRWREIVAEAISDAADPEGAFAALWEHFARADSWQLASGAANVMDRLARRGLAVGVASNFDQRLEQVCAGLLPLENCRIFTSSAVGWRKPSQRFFRAVEQALGLPPEALLLVGDDLDNDYRAATAAGWHAILISDTNATEMERRISRLEELGELLAAAYPDRR